MSALFLAGAGPALAQDETVQSSASASYTFGQALRFNLEARSDRPIEAVVLYFNTPQMTNTFVVNFDLEPSTSVSIRHEVPLTQVRLAPFTTVTYWWRLESGEKVVTLDEHQLAYADDRFQWQQMQAEGTTIYWTGDDPAVGQAALDVVDETRPQLESLIPPADLSPLLIYVYPSTADLRSALRLNGQEWVAAEARPQLGAILVTAVNPRTAAYDLGQSIPHEMAHLAIYEATGVGYERVPRWFEEGLATLVELSPNPNNRILVEEAVRTGASIPFAQLCAAFPSEESEARLAYAQSVSLVRYIQGQHGNRALGELVRAYADGAGCRSGVERVLGLSLPALNEAWLDYEQPLSPLGRFWQENGIWLALLGGGFGMMLLLMLPLRRRGLLVGHSQPGG